MSAGLDFIENQIPVDFDNIFKHSPEKIQDTRSGRRSPDRQAQETKVVQIRTGNRHHLGALLVFLGG
jgi:hypothetical protein